MVGTSLSTRVESLKKYISELITFILHYVLRGLVDRGWFVAHFDFGY